MRDVMIYLCGVATGMVGTGLFMIKVMVAQRLIADRPL